MNEKETILEYLNNKLVKFEVSADLRRGEYEEIVFLPRTWWEEAKDFFTHHNEDLYLGELNGKHSDVFGAIYMCEEITKKDIEKYRSSESYEVEEMLLNGYISDVLDKVPYEDYLYDHTTIEETDFLKKQQGLEDSFDEAYKEVRELLSKITVNTILGVRK
jgi:hypothetical protein